MVILIKEKGSYGEVTGVIWLQASCQPVGIFPKTMLAWKWPLMVLPLIVLSARHPIDRDRDIAAVNADFHVRIHFNSAELGGA